MASRVWCRSLKTTRKSAQNIPERTKNPKKNKTVFAVSQGGQNVPDCYFYIDITLVTLIHGCAYLSVTIFNM